MKGFWFIGGIEIGILTIPHPMIVGLHPTTFLTTSLKHRFSFTDSK